MIISNGDFMSKLLIGVIIAIIVVGGIGVAYATDIIEFDEDKKKDKDQNDDEDNQENVVAVITANRTQVKVNENITFDASQSQGNITSYIWDFGDNSLKGNNVSMVHSYTNGGKYMVNLTVVGSEGSSGYAEIVIGVNYHQEENGTLYSYPILPDTDNATVPVLNGSMDMNINLTIDPITIENVDMDITIYDSNNTAIYNETHEGVSQQETFFHKISNFNTFGNYNIELHITQGGANYDMAIDVTYKDS